VIWDDLTSKRIILASKSPRRHELMRGLHVNFEIQTKEIDESFPSDLKAEAIPEFLARKKADAFRPGLRSNEILITADTIVWQDGDVFNKPSSPEEALEMLTRLSGKMHEVFTGVCITSSESQKVFSDRTKVYFAQLSEDELKSYIREYKPFDKAGSYGIQEWLGYAGIEKIEGSFYNVMGLPTRALYRELKKFVKDEA
jgi:septum formation protein